MCWSMWHSFTTRFSTPAAISCHNGSGQMGWPLCCRLLCFRCCNHSHRTFTFSPFFPYGNSNLTLSLKAFYFHLRPQNSPQGKTASEAERKRNKRKQSSSNDVLNEPVYRLTYKQNEKKKNWEVPIQTSNPINTGRRKIPQCPHLHIVKYWS